MVIISSIWSLTVMTEDALAAADRFGTDQLYSTADEDDDDAPAWFLNNGDPEDVEKFLMTSHVLCPSLQSNLLSSYIA